MSTVAHELGTEPSSASGAPSLAAGPSAPEASTAGVFALDHGAIQSAMKAAASTSRHEPAAVVAPAAAAATLSAALAGAVFCISGALSLGEKEMTTLLQAHGATVASSVTAKVTHVLTSAADAAKKTSKIASAEAKDIPVVGESFVAASIAAGKLAAAGDHHPAAPVPSERPAVPPKRRYNSTVTAVDEAAQGGELRLLSTTDGGETQVALAVVAQSSTLDHGSDKLDPALAVPIPTTTLLIRKMIDWMQHEWHRCANPISATEQQAYIDSYFSDVNTSAEFVALLAAGDYLQIDSLIDAAVSVLFAPGKEGARTAESFRQLHGVRDDTSLLDCALLGEGMDVDAADGDGDTALHLAAIKNDSGSIELLLKAGAKADCPNRDGITPLMIALSHDDGDGLECVKLLLAAGAKVDYSNKDGVTPLLRALSHGGSGSGSLENVKLLLASGAKGMDVDAADGDGDTALHLAAAKNDSESIELLLKAGSKADCPNRDGITPLMIALSPDEGDEAPQSSVQDKVVSCLNDPIVKMLRDACDETLDVDSIVAKVVTLCECVDDASDSEEEDDDEDNESDQSEQVEVDAATVWAGLNTSNPLIHALTTTATAASLSWVQLELCDEVCLSLQKWADEEKTRRLAAITSRKAKREAALNDAKVDEEEATRLDRKLWEAVGSGDLQAAQQAFDAGACLDLIKGDEDDKEHKSVMRRAYMDRMDQASTGQIGLSLPGLIDFLSGNTDERASYDHLHTLVMVAAFSGSLEVINWLLDLGCDVNSSQPDDIVRSDGFGYGGMTPLMCASSLSVVQLLCARGADASAWYTPSQYEDNLNPIPTLTKHCAFYSKDDVEIARCLIKHGANVNEITRPSSGQWDWDTGMNSYWPQVVAAGDVNFAAELLEKHDADSNWPHGLGEKYCAPNTDSNLESVFGEFGERDRLTGVAGPTVLMMAIAKSDKAMVKLLLSAGADANLTELLPEDNEVPPHYGLGDRHQAEVKAHYGLGDDCIHDDVLRVPEEKKANPLSIAAAIGNVEIIELLRAAGAVAHESALVCRAKTACPGCVSLNDRTMWGDVHNHSHYRCRGYEGP
jgi:ankyrin repeat protein